MTKYRGQDWELRIATSEVGLLTANAIPYVTATTVNVDQGASQTPTGIGSRKQEVYEGLIGLSGSVERDYDETAVSSTDIFREAVESDVTGAMAPLYLLLKNKITSSTVTIRKAKGNYSGTTDQDGYAHETYDFQFEEVAYS